MNIVTEEVSRDPASVSIRLVDASEQYLMAEQREDFRWRIYWHVVSPRREAWHNE
jgi:hypothetical protein